MKTFLRHLTSVLHPPSFVLCHPIMAVIRHPSSDYGRPPSSVIWKTVLCLLSSVFCLHCPAAQLPIVSDFSTDADGWSVDDLTVNGPFAIAVTNYSPVFVSIQGNTGGYIEFTDQTGNTYYFEAPPKFLGDKSAAYGLTLDFDLRFTSPGGYIFDSEPDVVLVGNGMVLVVNASPAPQLNQWTHFSVLLNEQAGWKKDSLAGTSPSQTEFISVFASLTALRIRGEYVSSGYDTADLDNVVLGTQPNSITNTSIRTAVEVSWPSQSNTWYQVQWASDVDTNTWFNFNGLVPGNGFTNSIFDSPSANTKRFYRVLRLNAN